MAKVVPNDIFQYSLLSAHTAGLQDGGPPVAFISTQGNHGIGIFEVEEDDDEDDEDDDDEDDNPPKSKPKPTTGPPTPPNDLIQLDGAAYTIDRDGAATPAAKDDCLPFVMTTHFQPTSRASPPAGSTAKHLRDILSGGTPTSTSTKSSSSTTAAVARHNTPRAFRARGTFRYINTSQATYWDVRGAVVGFSVPTWMLPMSGGEGSMAGSGNGAGGLRAGFLSEDRHTGGRLIDFETGPGVTVEWARAGRLHLGFPMDEEFDTLRI